MNKYIYNYQKKIYRNKRKKSHNLFTNPWNYVCICSYNNLNKNQINEIKNQGIHIQYFKKTVFPKSFKLAGKGPIALISFKDHSHMAIFFKILNVKKNNAFNLIYISHKCKTYTIIKIKNIMEAKLPLPYQLKQNINNFWNTILKITL